MRRKRSLSRPPVCRGITGCSFPTPGRGHSRRNRDAWMCEAGFWFAKRSRGPKIQPHAHPGTEFKMKTVVIAIGDNSLIKDAQHMSVPDQYAAVVETARHITDLLERRYHIVITHGNGPQVGFILLRSEHSRGILHQVPIDSIVADTQGALGYQIQQALENEFHRRGLKKSVATVVTQTLVD